METKGENKMKEYKFKIICRESGDSIEGASTIEEAEKIIEDYEKTDKNEGNYEPDFYEIVEEETK
jgi:hypothetical protein